MTNREQILQAVMTALTGTTGVSQVYRSRVQAFNRSEHPAMIVEPVSDSASHNTIPRVIWDLIFTVTLLVRADEPDSTADAIVSDAYNKIMSNVALLNLVVDLQPIKTDWNFIEADGGTLGIIINQFKCTYQTSLTDLAST